MRQPTRRGLIPLLTLLLGVAAAQAAEPASPAASPLRRDLEDRRSPAQRLGDVVDPVQIDGISARRALEWFSRTTQIPVVINWDTIASDGINPDQPISLDLRTVPAGQLLALIMKQLATDQESLIYELSPWYVEVLTKSMANRRAVTRIYDIGDLLVVAPRFEPPAGFDLQSALGSGGGGRGSNRGSSSTGLFSQTTTVNTDVKPEAERGEEIAKLIRDTIEPAIWVENGGQYASIKYYQRRLIIKAPLYVHAQIGLPSMASELRSTPAAGAGADLTVRTPALKDPVSPGANSGRTPQSPGVSGVQRSRGSPVSGTH